MARIIRNRGLETDEQIDMYLNGTVDKMHSPHLLKDADKCVDILIEKINAGKKIHIIGDYDIDGICSTTILSGTANVTSAPAALRPLYRIVVEHIPSIS